MLTALELIGAWVALSCIVSPLVGALCGGRKKPEPRFVLPDGRIVVRTK